MPEKKPAKVYVIHGRGAQRGYEDAQAAIAHVPAELRSCAAVLSALSLVAMSLSAVWRDCAADLRRPSRAFCWRWRSSATLWP